MIKTILYFFFSHKFVYTSAFLFSCPYAMYENSTIFNTAFLFFRRGRGVDGFLISGKYE